MSFRSTLWHLAIPISLPSREEVTQLLGHVIPAAKEKNQQGQDLAHLAYVYLLLLFFFCSFLLFSLLPWPTPHHLFIHCTNTEWMHAASGHGAEQLRAHMEVDRQMSLMLKELLF